jgi:hypothetical protein|tara:strand:+ start:318 stop:908 length:591 start_codon:yes stop_codon:yes gene_type:complete
MIEYIKISNGNGKMQDIKSINTNTITNDYCMTKCTFKGQCYSKKHIARFTNNASAWELNSNKLSQSIIDYDLLPKFFNTKIIRFHSHGELINNTHLINFRNICNKNSDIVFTLFTKRNDLIKRLFRYHKKPKNLILIFSNSKFNKPMNKIPLYFDKTFNVITKDSNIKANCSGKCKDCMICYTLDSKEKHIIEVIK